MKKWILIGVILSLFSCTGKNVSETGINVDLLTMYTADSARADYKKGNFRILVFGLRVSMGDDDSVNVIDRKYGITYYEAAGCEVTSEFMAGVKQYNDEMIRLMEKQNGKKWYERYLKEIGNYQD